LHERGDAWLACDCRPDRPQAPVLAVCRLEDCHGAPGYYLRRLGGDRTPHLPTCPLYRIRSETAFLVEAAAEDDWETSPRLRRSAFGPTHRTLARRSALVPSDPEPELAGRGRAR